jgi:hypothetical protein
LVDEPAAARRKAELLENAKALDAEALIYSLAADLR